MCICIIRITRKKYSLCRATCNLLCKDYCIRNFYERNGKCVNLLVNLPIIRGNNIVTVSFYRKQFTIKFKNLLYVFLYIDTLFVL